MLQLARPNTGSGATAGRGFRILLLGLESHGTTVAVTCDPYDGFAKTVQAQPAGPKPPKIPFFHFKIPTPFQASLDTLLKIPDARPIQIPANTRIPFYDCSTTS
jgi:hypothetical protein